MRLNIVRYCVRANSDNNGNINAKEKKWSSKSRDNKKKSLNAKHASKCKKMKTTYQDKRAHNDMHR